jgi:hypothetical protein
MKNGFLAMACMVIGLAGCAKSPPPLPPTYPVHGRVTYRDGSPVTDGLVQFQSQEDRSIVTNAVIQKDGGYSLVTKRGRLQAEGAIVGSHSVMITPASDRNDVKRNSTLGRLLPIILSTPFNVEARDNEFTLVADQP